MKEAKTTEVKINEARENYRPAAARASLLYFILNDLNKINPIYQFSLKVWPRPGSGARALASTEPRRAAWGGLGVQLRKPPCSPPQAFNVVFEKAIQRTAPAEEVRQRVVNLTDEITYSVYMYTARGLFERDKLIFLAQVTFQVRLASPLQGVLQPAAAAAPKGWSPGQCWLPFLPPLRDVLGTLIVDMRHCFKGSPPEGEVC